MVSIDFDGIIICAACIHVIFILSIFDIYFKSPVVSGVEPVQNDLTPLANRVVLISVDGLRVDSLFDVDPDTKQHVAPYIRNIIETQGSWGISESHLPTESRPGHVSLIAGFYEDPSAVTKGWKQNPVDFDSLFNRTKCSFAWGSPDIVPMFVKGATQTCLHYETYSDEHQQFAGVTTAYDDWVYDKFKEYIHKSWSDNLSGLHMHKVMFFLHLLGQDTAGHTHKPHTLLYRKNLKNVDNLVFQFEAMFQKYYQDNKTAFVLTSDHGMTDWGSHGSGDLAETQTPFIVWGSGIKKPQKVELGSGNPWGLSNLKQRDINQADITPFIAVLLGISIPVNSIGILPHQYLSASEKFIAESILVNAQQIAAQFLRKLELTKEQSFWLFYRPFSRLEPNTIKERVLIIKKYIDSLDFAKANEDSKDLLNLSLEGLDYFQNYYQRPLFVSLSLSYILWMLLLLLRISYGIEWCFYMTPTFTGVIFTCSVVCTVVIVYFQSLPFSYYFYLLLPQFLCRTLALNMKRLTNILHYAQNINVLIVFISLVVAIELLVMSFFMRWVLMLPVLCIIFWGSQFHNKQNIWVLTTFIVSGIGLSIFTLLPVIGKKPKIFQVLGSGVLWSLFGILVTFFILKQINLTERLVSITGTLLLATATWNNFCVYYYFDKYNEVPLNHHIISWTLWVISTFLPFLGSKQILSRLFNIYVGLAVPFLLMSVNHESFFLLTLIVHIVCWLYLEHNICEKKFYISDISEFYFHSNSKHINQTGLSTSDFRKAYFFITYILISFFGTGNIASLNSFDPVWVRCFITTFSPFTMTALILYKTIIPFLVVTCCLQAMSIMQRLDMYKVFLVVLIFSNFMGLNFLFLVTNKGSWLDIGTSISHYVIQQATVLFLVILYAAAKILTSYSCILWKESTTINKLERLQSVFLPIGHLRKSHSH